MTERDSYNVTVRVCGIYFITSAAQQFFDQKFCMQSKLTVTAAQKMHNAT